jgi:hypothetical protein
MSESLLKDLSDQLAWHRKLGHDVVRIDMSPDAWDDLVSEMCDRGLTPPAVMEGGMRRIVGTPVRLCDDLKAPIEVVGAS